MAAATATVLSTRLGLVGTVIGAVVASVVSTLVSTVFVRWLERAHGRVTDARDDGPRLWQRLAVGALAVTLVGVAFHTGFGLLTHDLPHDAFASRLLTQLRTTSVVEVRAASLDVNAPIDSVVSRLVASAPRTSTTEESEQVGGGGDGALADHLAADVRRGVAADRTAGDEQGDAAG